MFNNLSTLLDPAATYNRNSDTLSGILADFFNVWIRFGFSGNFIDWIGFGGVTHFFVTD